MCGVVSGRARGEGVKVIGVCGESIGKGGVEGGALVLDGGSFT